MTVERNEDWCALADLIHPVIDKQLGDCPDNGDLDAGLCHDVADAVIEAGWRRAERAS